MKKLFIILAMLICKVSLFAQDPVHFYLKIQQSLAHDDFESAISHAKELNEHSKEFKQLPQLLEAPDIDSLRQNFLALSEELVVMLDEGRLKGIKNLVLATCPMAFSGKGGDWVQEGKQILNPYYGASMLRCGSIKYAFDE
jgi:Cu(I)/Ag(I) efflux system membrane fusion protein